MTNKSKHQALVDNFRAEAKALLKDVRNLANELAARERAIRSETIGIITIKEEHGEHYRQNILQYVNDLEAVTRSYNPAIFHLAEAISKSITHAYKALPPRPAKNYRRDMWSQLALALEPLSGRPTKKVAALLVSPDEKMLTWDVNHLCYGVPKRAELYEKGVDGGRGIHTWCAERNVIAKHLNIKAEIPEDAKLVDIHKALGQFTFDLTSAALHDKDLKKYTLVSSHYPCMICSRVLAPQSERVTLRTVKEIITIWNTGTETSMTSAERRTSDSETRFKKAGIPVRMRIMKGAHMG